MSDINTTQIFAPAEKNITATKMNNIIGLATIDPNFYASKPTASSVNPTDQMLILSGGAYAQAPFSTVTNSVGNSMGPQITAVRLRSFNAIGNPTFEVDQRNVGNVLTNPGSGTFALDRWLTTKSAGATFAANYQKTDAQVGEVFVPGTNFRIARSFLRITLTTAQVSLAASDYWRIVQFVEGPQTRELQGDVHSISLLVRSSVTGLKFGCLLRDAGATQALAKLCTIPSAATWTLISLPNLSWASGMPGSVPGTVGYELVISFGAGATLTVPANDTWQSGNFLAASGQDSFASKAVNSTFDIAFVQHEPGSQCTTFIDCSFGQNLDGPMGCDRYFQKTYPYATAPGAVTTSGLRAGINHAAVASAYGPFSFRKTMAKTPTMLLYNYATGAVNSVRDGAAVDHGSAIVSNVGDSGFSGIGFSTATTTPMYVYCHYTADTGW